jgi:putative hydrolase of the HAD superfamily
MALYHAKSRSADAPLYFFPKDPVLKSKMLKTIFFDAAGTLFETREPVGSLYAMVAREFGAHVSAREIHAAFRHSFGNAPGLAFGPGHSPEQLRRLERQWWRERVAETFAGLHRFEDFDAFFDALFEFFGDSANWTVYDDVFPALDELRAAGLRLAIISNFDARLYRILAGLGLDRYFDSVTISSEAGYAKPAPQVFEFALARSGASADEVLHVGDAPHLDVAGATAAGIEAILICRPEERVGASISEGSTKAISSLAELVQLLAAEHNRG